MSRWSRKSDAEKLALLERVGGGEAQVRVEAAKAVREADAQQARAQVTRLAWERFDDSRHAHRMRMDPHRGRISECRTCQAVPHPHSRAGREWVEAHTQG